LSDEAPIDLNQRRLEKAIAESKQPVLGGPVPTGGTVVSVLGCGSCGSTEFRLGHHDPLGKRASNVILCARCCVQIESLRWVDITLETPTA
jgi:hypothetical protein